MQEDLFATGGYEALTIVGAKADQALGYLRSGGGERLAVFVARYPGLRDVGPDWSGTMASLSEGRWTDWLTGRSFKGGSVAAMADLLYPSAEHRGYFTEALLTMLWGSTWPAIDRLISAGVMPPGCGPRSGAASARATIRGVFASASNRSGYWTAAPPTTARSGAAG